MVPPWEGSWGPEPRAGGAFHRFMSCQSCECACVRACVEMEHGHSGSVLLTRFSPKASLTTTAASSP